MKERNGLRKEEIFERIARIEDSVSYVENKLPSDLFKLKNNRELRNSVYKEIEFAIQNVIDICAIINSDLRLGVPETEEEIIENMEKNDILDKNITKKIEKIKGFRNVLVHKYGKVDDEIAHDSIKHGLKDFGIIVDEFRLFLTRRGGNNGKGKKQNGKT